MGGRHSSPETIPPLSTLQNDLILWKELAIYSLPGALHFTYWQAARYKTS